MLDMKRSPTRTEPCTKAEARVDGAGDCELSTRHTDRQISCMPTQTVFDRKPNFGAGKMPH